MMVPPGFRKPFSSASRIIPTPMRSFTEPPGFRNSHLARISAVPLPAKRDSRTIGVDPMRSSAESATTSGRAVSTLISERTLAARAEIRGERSLIPPPQTRLSGRPSLAVAVAAIDGLAVRGVERHLRRLAACVARHVVELARASVAETAHLALVAAVLAALGLVREALLRVKLLLVGREREGGAAVDTGDGLVRVHQSSREGFRFGIGEPWGNRGLNSTRNCDRRVGVRETFTGSGTSGGFGGAVSQIGPRGLEIGKNLLDQNL